MGEPLQQSSHRLTNGSDSASARERSPVQHTSVGIYISVWVQLDYVQLIRSTNNDRNGHTGEAVRGRDCTLSPVTRWNHRNGQFY